MVRRTKEEALATRNRILDAAEALFQQRGVSRTSLHEIAEAAEVTRGAIYWHFRDKADLFNAMMERATMPFEEAMGGCGQRRADENPVDFICRRLVEALRITATHPQTRRVFEISTHKVEYVDELLQVRDRHLAGRNECLAECERELKAAMRQGLIVSKVPARCIALGLHALVDGLIQNWMLDPKAFDLVKVGKQVLDTYLGGLRPAQPEALARAPRRRAAAVRDTAA
ncbi:MAG: TetR family transcriptional regulator [Pseudomonadota bacterium]